MLAARENRFLWMRRAARRAALAVLLREAEGWRLALDFALVTNLGMRPLRQRSSLAVTSALTLEEEAPER